MVSVDPIFAKYLANPTFVNTYTPALPKNYVRENMLPLLRASLDYMDTASDQIRLMMNQYGSQLSDLIDYDTSHELTNPIDESPLEHAVNGAPTNIVPIRLNPDYIVNDNYGDRKIA